MALNDFQIMPEPFRADFMTITRVQDGVRTFASFAGGGVPGDAMGLASLDVQIQLAVDALRHLEERRAAAWDRHTARTQPIPETEEAHRG